MEHFECVRVTKGGRNIHVSLTISPIKNASGNIFGISKIARDITEHKQAEESIKAARDEISRHALELEKRVTERTASLRQSVQSLESVLYHVAHDLRAPLRAMQGFTTILLNEYAPKLDEKGEDYAQRVSTAASRMDTLIQDLLRYGRLAHTPLSLVAVNLNQELEVVQGRLAEKIRNKGAVISVESPLPEVWADPVVLDEILSNLLKNALTFVAPGVRPKIHIRAEPAGPGLVRIWMADNGVGIGAEHHERIFRVFERLQIEDVYTGTGIGLALVRKGMERMGGRSGVESKPGEGSRFWLELPTMQRMNE
jgi:signal transduction histidine kinase